MSEIKIIPETIQLVRMTDAEYFSSAYKDYISNSRLGLIDVEAENPFHKFEVGYKEEYSESFELGSAIHAMLLQKDDYYIAEINKPSGKLGLFAQEVFKLRQQGLSIKEATTQASQNANYYASKFSETRLKTAIKGSLAFYLQRMKFKAHVSKEPIFLSSSLQFKYESCMANIYDNSSKILSTLYPHGILNPLEYFNEYAILCEVDVIIEGKTIRLKLKGKLDNFVLDHETKTVTLNDLKSTGKPISYFMGNYVQSKESSDMIWYDGSFQKYGYYRQMGLYLWLLRCALKELYDLEYTPKVNMLVVETIPEFKNKIFPVSGKYINAGLSQFQDLLTLLAKWIDKKQEN